MPTEAAILLGFLVGSAFGAFAVGIVAGGTRRESPVPELRPGERRHCHNCGRMHL